MKDSSEGQARLKRQVDRENEYISRFMEKQDEEAQARKKPKPDISASTEGGAEGGQQQPMEVAQHPIRYGLAPSASPSASSSCERLPDDTDPKRQKIEPQDAENPMETNIVERLCQDDMRWDLHNTEDMCEKEDPELQRKAADFSYYDENS